MAPKVVHLSEEAHIAAKDFCQKNGLKLKEWVEGLIEREIGSPQVRATLEPKLTTVAKKKTVPTTPETGEEDGPRPWEQPPFWQREQRDPKPAEAVKEEVKPQLERDRREAPVGGGEPASGEGRAAGATVIELEEVHRNEGGGLG